MESEPTLLVIWHSRTGASAKMAEAVACDENALLMRVDEIRPDHLLSASGYVFVGPENLAALSGQMKEMFDSNYYAMLGKLEGRPYASVIAAGSDGEGAQRQLDRIATGWRLKRVAEPMIVNFAAQSPEEILAPKSPSDAVLKQCRDLGEAMAEALRLGIS